MTIRCQELRDWLELHKANCLAHFIEDVDRVPRAEKGTIQLWFVPKSERGEGGKYIFVHQRGKGPGWEVLSHVSESLEVSKTLAALDDYCGFSAVSKPIPDDAVSFFMDGNKFC